MMQRTLVSLSLAFFLLSSVVAAPVSAQAVNDPKQPSVENPHMHFWGTGDIASCWTHFDGNDSTGSSETGRGEKSFNSGQQVDVSFTCRMQDNFRENMHLNPNGTILIEVGVRIYSASCNPDEDQNCKDLTLTLYKGNKAVATQDFPAVGNDYNDEQVRWELPVDMNMTEWNKSSEEPSIQVEFSKPGVSGVECIILDCTGEFWFYYSNNEDGMNVEVNWPIINSTVVVDPEEGPGDGGGSGNSLPGFGLTAGLASLALAAVAGSSRLSRD